MDLEIIKDTEIQRVPLTQDTSKSQIKYAWVILFLFDLNEKNPFRIAKLRDFIDSNFPWRSIKGELTKECRIRLHEFSCYPGKQYFIFAKIQYGTVHLFHF